MYKDQKNWNLGRANDNDIVISDPSNSVSSNHAVLERINNKFFITDKSSNGTFVNGTKIPADIRFPVSRKDSILLAQHAFDWSLILGDKKPPIITAKSRNIVIGIVLGLVLIFSVYKLIPSFGSFGSLDATELYEKYNKSVVLVYHSFYYTVNIDNSPVVYIGLNSNNEYEYSADPNDIYPVGIEGTGFFIANDGKIITNRHVAFPWTSNKDETEFELTNPKLFNVYQTIMGDINSYLTKTNQGHLSREFSGKTTFVGIALNNSFVNSIDDFTDCIQIKHHNDQEIDLALMQTKNKELPKSATIIKEKDYATKINVGEMATIIGYPGGTSFQAKKGSATELKAITNEGRISQNPGDKKVMYQVPTTGGASGSPVFNSKGELIAIHFSGFQLKQGFNYGILVKYIDELIK